MGGRIAAALAIAGGLLAVALVVRSSEPAGPPPERADLAFTLEDMNGVKVNLASFAGRPIVINLWATWCAPCIIETPQLVALADRFKDRGLVMIGISTDDEPDAIRKFAAEYKVTYPMLVGLGQEEFFGKLGYEGFLPISILIKPDGTISERVTGLKTTEDWERRIGKLF
jgi:peroxiredoxin